MSTKSLPLSTPYSLHTHLLHFLTLSIHTILHARNLYPASTFLLTRAYNFPVPQSRHPAVCAYINSCVSAIAPHLHEGTLSTISIVVFTDANKCLERYVFDVGRLPVVPKGELFTEFEGAEEMRTVDVEEELRAVLRRLGYEAGRLGDLPKNSTWGVIMEMKEDADAPIGHPQPFEPSPAELQIPHKSKSKSKSKGKGKGKEPETSKEKDTEVETSEIEHNTSTPTSRVGRDLGGVKSVAIRAVEVGAFVMEAWIEEC